MSNLLDSVREYATPELIGNIARQLGESEGGISKAVSGLAPVLLAGLIVKTGEPAAAEHIFQIVKNSGHTSGIVFDPSRPPSKQDFPAILFGAGLPAIINAVAAFSGTRPSSVSFLLDMLSPAVTGMLHGKIKAGQLDAAGFHAWLLDEQNTIFSALPTGLSSILGLPVQGHPDKNTPAAGGNPWLWPFLLLSGLGGGLLVYLKGC